MSVRLKQRVRRVVVYQKHKLPCVVFFQLKLRVVLVLVPSLELDEATARGLENWKLINLFGYTVFDRRVFNKPQL